MTITFASYNIQYGKGQDRRFDLDRIAAEIEAADVIALQEVASGFARNEFEDQAEWFARRLNRHAVFGATYDVDASFTDPAGRVVNRRRRFGNMVLSRWPIRSTRTLPLPFSPPMRMRDVQRCAVEAVIDLPGGPIRLYSLHLSHLTPDTRIPQVMALRAMVEAAPREGMAWTDSHDADPDNWAEGWAAPVPPEPCILMGDFNLRPDGPEYPLLAGLHYESNGRVPVRGQFVDSWVAAGHTEASGWTLAEWAGQEGARIDYAFLHPSLAPKLRRAWVDTQAQGSDHLPIWIEMELG
jgi:endonuclease/exonuclease/phosphatase family metal-dependent hydrolase